VFKLLSNEELLETMAAIEGHGSVTAAAEALGLSRSTVQNRVRQASIRGLNGTLSSEVHPGFDIARISTHVDKEGNLSGWLIQQPESPAREQLIEAIRDAFKDYEGAATPVEPKAFDPSSILTVYPIPDHHLGLLAWAPEAGQNYDLSIGEALLMETMGSLVAQSNPSETALLLNLGDFFHADNNKAETERSHNRLDVDGRWAKVLQVGVSLMVRAISLALTKHNKVIVRCLPGNHDPHSGLFLSVALASFFSREPRVTVDMDPSPFFMMPWGKTMLAATHGDQVKPLDMPGVMASKWPKVWGETVHRYAYFGHVHHKSIGGGERNGVTWETFRTLAAKDAWHSANGFTSQRSMVAIEIDKEYGEVIRHTVTIKDIEQ